MTRIIVPEYPEVGLDELDRGGSDPSYQTLGNYFGSPTVLKFLGQLNNIGAELLQQDLFLFKKVSPNETLVLSDAIDFRDRLLTVSGSVYSNNSEATRDNYWPNASNEHLLHPGAAWNESGQSTYQIIYTRAGIDAPPTMPYIHVRYNDNNLSGHIWADENSGNLMFWNDSSKYCSVFIYVLATPQLGVYSEVGFTESASYIWEGISLQNVIHRSFGNENAFNDIGYAIENMRDITIRLSLNKNVAGLGTRTQYPLIGGVYLDFRNRFMQVRGFTHIRDTQAESLAQGLTGANAWQTFPDKTGILPVTFYPASNPNNQYWFTANGVAAATYQNYTTESCIRILDNTDSVDGRLWVRDTDGSLMYYQTNPNNKYVGNILRISVSEQVV